MKSKLILYAGIVFLLAGLLLMHVLKLNTFGLSLIILGVLCKLAYIIIKMINKEYKPGYEMGLLFIGLLLFLGLRHFLPQPFSWIIATGGILLKVSFVILFIRKVRANRND